jgi:LSD1 subclass zinc finger protein
MCRLCVCRVVRYAYGAQSVKCAVCNFVTQVRRERTVSRRGNAIVRSVHLTAPCVLSSPGWRTHFGNASTRLRGRRCALPAAPCRATCLTVRRLSCLRCFCRPPAGSRPQQRPQMVVVENPPTMDDEGKMVRPRALRCLAAACEGCTRRPGSRSHRCPTWRSAWRRSDAII